MKPSTFEFSWATLLVFTTCAALFGFAIGVQYQRDAAAARKEVKP